jgi:hypothetical protein
MPTSGSTLVFISEFCVVYSRHSAVFREIPRNFALGFPTNFAEVKSNFEKIPGITKLTSVDTLIPGQMKKLKGNIKSLFHYIIQVN